MNLIKPRQISYERRRKVYQEIAVGSEPGGSFYTMVILSTIIAAFGLLTNSTAVVIGAMLVAPLMTPILGIALSLTSSDSTLLGRAAAAEVLGIALSVGLGLALGVLMPDVVLGPEILVRTTPTVFDIVVAIAAGLAGAYSMVDERLNAALPGVAIATSLVPPLSACGLCLSQGRFDLASGAFLLFSANFLSIQIVGGFVFATFGVSGASAKSFGGGALTVGVFMRRFALNLVLLGAVTVFMTDTLYSIISERRFHRRIEATLGDELRKNIGGDLVDLRYQDKQGAVRVAATVRAPQEVLPADVANLEALLNQGGGPWVKLIIRSILSKDMDAGGPVFTKDRERLRPAGDNGEAALLASINHALADGLKDVPGANLANVRKADEGKTVIATVRTPTAIEPRQVKSLQDALRARFDPELRLVVSSVITRDADAERFVYEAPSGEKQVAPAPLTGDALEYYKRLESSLKNQVGRAMVGANLKEFRYGEDGALVRVLATVRAPRNFTPEEVRAVQEGLQADVDPRIRLVVRSVVGADATAETYLPSIDEKLFSGGE